MTLKTYRAKRAFEKTAEPSGKKRKKSASKEPLQFVIQKHAARRLHYDLRLELDGVLKSWAVPKGPSLDPSVKRLAIEVEDHPLEYASFEGIIPQGEYGAGKVIVWDNGTYRSEGKDRAEQEKYIREHLEKGELHFFLSGKKLKGEFILIRLKRDPKKKEWLLFKKKDSFQSTKEVTDQNASVISDETIDTDLNKASKAPMPHHIKPMLAVLVDKPFDRENWIFEIKWDGYRAIAEIAKGNVQLYSRNLLSFNEKFPTLVKSLQRLKGDMVLDGEIVLLDSNGLPQFQLLQNYLNSGESGGALKYCVFDILYYRGHDLRSLPLLQRKQILKEVIESISAPNLTYSDYVKEKGIDFFNEASKSGVEGIMGKDAESPYIAKRSSHWVKTKTLKRQEVVIAGFTKPRGGRKFIGSLIVGIYKNKVLTYAGHVGGGFSQKSLEEMHRLLKPLVVEKCPFRNKPKTNMAATWVKPKLICEVSFQEWTGEGIMRQPIFHGLRFDKNSKSVEKEIPVSAEDIPKKKSKTKHAAPADDNVTNPDKVFWPKEGYTKGDLLSYYQEVSSTILPHLRDRPMMLHRFPNGIKGMDFFQKNAPEYLPEWIEKGAVQHTEKKIDYILIQDLKSLIYVINMAAIELHPFLSRIQSLDYPDFLILDLDPENLTFDSVIETAKEIHEILNRLSLEHLFKTSGKRGMHLYLPLHAKYKYEDVENFAKLLAQVIHQENPGNTSILRNPKDRQNKVYIDYLQNIPTKSVIAPYSVRAVEGAVVSTPLEWKEIKKGLDPHDFTIKTVPARIKKKGDLFKGVLGKGIDLNAALKKIQKLYL